jgi:hypothetical protein
LKAALLKAESIVKGEGIFQFMLACYECQLGNFESTKAALERAFDPNERLRLRALDEPELKPLWHSLGEAA